MRCTQWALQLAVFLNAITGQHFHFRPPVNEIGFPIVRAATGIAIGFKAHVFQRHVARQNHQVAPGQAGAVLLLHRPQQPTRLVEVAIVRPAVQGVETLLAAVTATAAIQRAVGARAMPRHANEKGAVVAVVGGPPVL